MWRLDCGKEFYDWKSCRSEAMSPRAAVSAEVSELSLNYLSLNYGVIL
jgi:hypothetical protein